MLTHFLRRRSARNVQHRRHVYRSILVGLPGGSFA